MHMISWKWTCLVTLLSIFACSRSQHENYEDELQRDSDTFTRLSHQRMSRDRNEGNIEDRDNERGITREERKRLKAERRRIKEERRQERWERRQKQKNENQRGRLDDTHYDQDLVEEDEELDTFQRHYQNGVPGTFSSSPAEVGVAGAPSRHELTNRESHFSHYVGNAFTSSSFQSAARIGSNDPVATEASTPTVIDIEWMRANLSSLWSVVRALSRQQGRTFFHRGGGRGKYHHSGAAADIPSPESCPGGEEACKGDSDITCGGHGVCACGRCFCQPGYYGTFCQCDDHSCPVYDGMPCGGPSRGQCRCGGCVCRNGYNRESCDCPTETQTCIQPGSGVTCSGEGSCECGRCKCGDGHKGMYCEDTVYAASVCEKLKSCVMCRAWNRDLPSCHSCQITVTTVESLEPSMTTCVMVNSGCLLQFSYIPETAESYNVLVPKDMTCP
ncbi:hypothetical protein SK128_009241 [Halocaridina rubra]|uniref:Integrin beta subunit tail domain-containing protein n=1 Tax=Halocaridina rubra TaxID=373956 RepID=A0AAN8XRR4_HALRR